MRIALPFVVALCLSLPTSSSASPDESPAEPAIETNVLWPFFPGGLFDIKVVVPVTRTIGITPPSGRLALTAGVFSDFAFKFVRDETDGRVLSMGAKFGARYFWRYGLHIEPVLQLNWRHEENRPEFDGTLDALQGRLWAWAGIERDLSTRVYVGARAGVGMHLFRTDELGDSEKRVVPAGDLNIGVRF